LQTYKRECWRAFSQTLQDYHNLDSEDVTLMMQAGRGRTNMYFHALKLLELLVWFLVWFRTNTITGVVPTKKK